MQDAFAEALNHWPQEGIPRNPAAWLCTVSKHKAIDALRKKKSAQRREEQVILLKGLEMTDDDVADEHFSDDVLRLVRTCCHPALSMEARVAVTLHTVCGLRTDEIARGFLLRTSLAQRLTRAKKKDCSRDNSLRGARRRSIAREGRLGVAGNFFGV
ncbi:MAG: hypothetical protein GY822_17490 [Deltaproteobacteria bacterium]|nr:hypothetical protein [Deltaproteobacteria bacterium]